MSAAVTEIERAVIEREQMKRRYAPPKRNNVKRAASFFSPVTTEPQQCQSCARGLANAKAELAQLTSGAISSDDIEKIRTLEQRVSTGLPDIVNDRSGDCVCCGCGSVVSRAASMSGDYSDFERVYPTARARTRENYMRERMSQWNLQEPPIPRVDCEKLRTAYNRGYGRLDSELEFDPMLNKHTVRAIILRAGLSTKKYTEKWMRIRIMLGANPHPLPTADLIHFILDRFKTVVRTWEQRGPDLCPPGHRRKSLFNYNYIITQLLLQHSVAAYGRHVEWFPVASTQKLEAMQTMWRAMCREIGWPSYVAIWENGEVVDLSLIHI
jgi:hypothetical protein